MIVRVTVCLYVYVCTCLRVCESVCMRVHVSESMHAFAWVYVCVYVCRRLGGEQNEFLGVFIARTASAQ